MQVVQQQSQAEIEPCRLGLHFFTSVCSDDYKKIKEGSNTKQVGATRFLFHQALQLWTSAGASKHSCHAMTNQVHVRLLMAHSHTASDTL